MFNARCFNNLGFDRLPGLLTRLPVRTVIGVAHPTSVARALVAPSSASTSGTTIAPTSIVPCRSRIAADEVRGTISPDAVDAQNSEIDPY